MQAGGGWQSVRQRTSQLPPWASFRNPFPVKLTHGLHLAYCTNVHRGGSWQETLASLERHTLAVRRAICPDAPYAIGLRLSDAASRELAIPAVLKDFQR